VKPASQLRGRLRVLLSQLLPNTHMSLQSHSLALVAALAIVAPTSPVYGQAANAVSAATLREHLFTISHDSMGGRNTGSRGNAMATAYVAARFRAAGLDPAGDDGTFFQNLPFVQVTLRADASIMAGKEPIPFGAGVVPGNRSDWDATGVQPLHGGAIGDTASWPRGPEVKGRLVLFASGEVSGRAARGLLDQAAERLQADGASAVGLIVAEQGLRFYAARALGTSLVMEGGSAGAPLPQVMVSEHAAATMLRGDLESASPGTTGPALQGGYSYSRSSPEWPVRNVVGILRGIDPALNHTYIAVTAHNDHVGTTSTPVDHDSLFAHNRVIRPLGADSRNRDATADEAKRIQAIRDSLGALRPSRRDSVFNGADDDGSGTVSLIEIARALAAGERPRRSVLFVSHAGEEMGLLGSRWFTEHPTVPRDSIIGDVDLDMVGRGPGAADPEYLEIVGSRRLSTRFGDLLEVANAGMAASFLFDYQFDAPGHPLRYYCRVDAYSYARHGIPVASLGRGGHPDYHQLTDEPQYIDYDGLARVATLVRDFVRHVANLDERPLVDGPVGDPEARCVQ